MAFMDLPNVSETWGRMRSDANALISVIVPVYNVEKYLDQCLESILTQTYRNLEVICINDGSTDRSLEIMKRRAVKDGRVRVIDKENGGYGQGCNLGIAESHGEWISIIEPDDWIDPDMYEEMLSFAGSFDERIDIIKTPWIDVLDWDDPSTQSEHPCNLRYRVRTSQHPFTIEQEPVLLAYHPSIWSAIYRRGFLQERGIRFIEYPGAGWADNPFLIEAFCQADAILYLDKAFYHYRADLADSTLNHKTVDAIVRPFDRWLTMADIMDRIGVVDSGVLSAHIMRGFMYVEGAIHDDGWNNPLVQEKAREVFRRMDQDLVLHSPLLSKRRKKLYMRMLGLSECDLSSPGRLQAIVAEAKFLFMTQGVMGVPNRVLRGVERKREQR